MEYHVHLYNVGLKPDTAYKVIGSGIPIHKIYLLNNKKDEYLEVEDQIRDRFRDTSIIVEKAEINPWDYHQVFDTVLRLYEEECGQHKGENVKFHVNFTMGTSIVVGAVCSAAHCIDADLYYVQEGCYSESGKDELITIRINSYEEIVELKSRPQTLAILLKMSEDKALSNDELRGSISKPNLSYHTRYLLDKGLIARESGVRNVKWILTEKGKIVRKRLRF